jgi:regulator of replication initiation timing
VEEETKTEAVRVISHCNTDGESEGGVTNITEASCRLSESDSDSDSDFLETERSLFIKKVEEKKAVQAKAEETKAEEAKAEEKKVEETKAEKKVEEKVDETKTEKKVEEKKSKEKKKTKNLGILEQTRRWSRDTQASAIHQRHRYQFIFNKYTSLQKQHKTLVAENDRFRKTETAARSAREELEILKQSNRERSLQIGNMATKIDILTSRLEQASKQLNESMEENAMLKREKKAMREEMEKKEYERRREEMERDVGDTQQIELHIPHAAGVVMDEVLAFDVEESDTECYENGTHGISCLHLSLTRKGKKITVRRRNTRKRLCRISDLPAPAAQRSRHD